MTSFGTHDSFTYLKPDSFWGWLALPFYRTQSKTLDEQLEDGWLCIDMRVTFDKNGGMKLAHGIVKLKSDSKFVYDSLKRISEQQKRNASGGVYGIYVRVRMYVRVILEDTKVKEEHEELFRNFCEYIVETYPNLIFFGGNRRCDWKQVYSFPNNPTLAQMCGSMAPDARWYERLIPWFYAKRKNEDNLDLEYDEDVAIFDFV